MRIAIYPGSFDPITTGHLDIIKRASCLFDKLIVAVVKNYSKKPLFTTEERMELIRRSTQGLQNVEVDCFEGLLVDYVSNRKAQVIIKGLRAISDFEYEFQMALLNSKLKSEIETLFLMTSHKYSYLSSSMVKEIAGLGGCIQDLVPEEVREDIVKKIKERWGKK